MIVVLIATITTTSRRIIATIRNRHHWGYIMMLGRCGSAAAIANTVLVRQRCIISGGQMVIVANTAGHLTVACRIIAACRCCEAIHPAAEVSATGGVGYQPTAVFLTPGPAAVGFLVPSLPVVAGLIVVDVVM